MHSKTTNQGFKFQVLVLRQVLNAQFDMKDVIQVSISVVGIFIYHGLYFGLFDTSSKGGMFSRQNGPKEGDAAIYTSQPALYDSTAQSLFISLLNCLLFDIMRHNKSDYPQPCLGLLLPGLRQRIALAKVLLFCKIFTCDYIVNNTMLIRVIF